MNEAATINQERSLENTSNHRYISTLNIDDTISPKDLIDSILRNKLLISGIVISCLIATFILLSIIPSRYSSDALLLIRSNDVTPVDSMLKSLQPVSDEIIENELEIIQSRSIAVKVIKSLGLDKNPEFNTILQDQNAKPNSLDNQFSLFEDKVIQANTKNIFDPDKALQEEAVLKKYYDGLSVTRKGSSQIIRIQYTATDPATAKNIVNAIIDQYIKQQLEMKHSEISETSEWLQDRVQSLQQKVAESETAVEQFRRESGLLESKGITLTAQQLAELNNQLIQSEKKYDIAKAKYNQINQLLHNPQEVVTLSTVRQSPIIQQLREKELQLQQKLSDFSAVYRPSHPDMIQLQGEIKEFHETFNQELENIKNGLKNELALTKTEKHSAQVRLDELKKKVSIANTATVKLRAMEREATANRKLLETLLSQLKKAVTHKDIDAQQPSIQVLSRAAIPVTPDFPKKVPILALAFVGFTLLAMLVVLIRESMDRGFSTMKVIEKQTGVPSLGYIPGIKAKEAHGKYPESYQVKQPLSSFSEAIRSLYTSIVLSGLNKPVKSILVTSALQQEGKTTIANTLAISRALSGHKTIIIDTDFKKANHKKALKIKPSPGLAGVLNGDVSLKKVIRKDIRTGTHLIAAGSLIQNAADLLMSDKMDSLLRTLNKHYDLIILDSPPILEEPNARILTSKVDATILVAKWNCTKKQFIIDALRNIAAQGNHIAGVVLNMVDQKKIGSHNDGYSEHPYRSANELSKI